MAGVVRLRFQNSRFWILLTQCPFLMTKQCNGIVDMMSHIFEQYFHEANNTSVQDEICEAALRSVMKTGEQL